MTSEQKAIEALERRVQELEDRLAIQQLITGYGYSVDGLNVESVGQRYAEDGVYDTGMSYYDGRAAIEQMVRTDPHQNFVRNGCAHVSSVPFVVLEGDQAVATMHHVVIRNGEDGFYIFRTSAGRLDLARKDDGGWEIKHRRHRLLDGDPEAYGQLARLNEGPGAPAATAEPEGTGTPR